MEDKHLISALPFWLLNVLFCNKNPYVGVIVHQVRLALYMNNQGLIPTSYIIPRALPVEIPECRMRDDP